MSINIYTENIENPRITVSHDWGVSCETCAYDRITKLDFVIARIIQSQSH